MLSTPLLPLKGPGSLRSTDSSQLLDSVSVCIFAYNEQDSIAACIDSIRTAADGAFESTHVTINVLANGCTDRTIDLVAEAAASDSRVVARVLEIGDKASAWNSYVHDIADLSSDETLHVFMDGDVTCTSDTLQSVLDAFGKSPDASACCILPAPGVGRNRALNLHLYDQDGAIFGNQYAVKNHFLSRVREAGIRIPNGAVGDDAIVTEMIALDLDRHGDYSARRATCADRNVGFIYRSMSPFRWTDIRLMFHRKIRYQIRTWRVPYLRQVNFHEMPESMEAIDLQIIDRLKGRRLWHPIEWMARRRLQRRQSISYSKSRTVSLRKT